MKHKKLPFETVHKGKCDTCSEKKYLDSMVVKEYRKGLYECIDCKVTRENRSRNEGAYHVFWSVESPPKKSRLKKIVGAVLG